ncbi:hypothetical protein RvY_16303-4 [Ramazzottius varieornatus]|uniref:Uncharacterized protein n=1 Tax=Ramazzottius varieornatus TaxID=947166 RepID=A0A1D1VXY8_RAMVA|nr:hypothetical protein RvY_16303-4 [Ramazzottius varieornatus]
MVHGTENPLPAVNPSSPLRFMPLFSFQSAFCLVDVSILSQFPPDQTFSIRLSAQRKFCLLVASCLPAPEMADSPVFYQDLDRSSVAKRWPANYTPPTEKMGHPTSTPCWLLCWWMKLPATSLLALEWRIMSRRSKLKSKTDFYSFHVCSFCIC